MDKSWVTGSGLSVRPIREIGESSSKDEWNYSSTLIKKDSAVRFPFSVFFCHPVGLSVLQGCKRWCYRGRILILGLITLFFNISLFFFTMKRNLSGFRLIGITFGNWVVRMKCCTDFAFPNWLKFSVNNEKYL